MQRPSSLLGVLSTCLLLATSSTLTAACRTASTPAALPTIELTELAVHAVSTDLSKPDPDAAFWGDVAPGLVSLMAQPVVAPRPETTTTGSIYVQAVHDAATVAFRLQWADTELSEAGHLGEFSDAVALEFPMVGDKLPSVMMGAKDDPVHLFHWRAQYQRDAERGKPEIKDLYPNVSVDMYPMDFKDAPGGTKDDQEAFNPGVAIGNPQSYSKTGVDEIIAEGFSTSSVEEGHGAAGRGVWRDGMWSVVITRPMGIDGGSTLVAGQPNALSFAVWQGGEDEVASRKCIHMAWLPLKVL